MVESYAICSLCLQLITPEIYQPVDSFLLYKGFPHSGIYSPGFPGKVPRKLRIFAQHEILLDEKKWKVPNLHPECYVQYFRNRIKINRSNRTELDALPFGLKNTQRFEKLLNENSNNIYESTLNDLRSYWQKKFPEMIKTVWFKIKVSPILAPHKIIEFITEQYPELLKNNSNSYDEIFKNLFKDKKVSIDTISEILGWSIEETNRYVNGIIN